MVLKNDSLSYFVYTYVLLFDSLCWQYSHMLFMLTVYTYFVFLIMQVVPTIYTNIRGWYCSILKMIFLYILKLVLLNYSILFLRWCHGVLIIGIAQYSMTEHFRNSKSVHLGSLFGVFFFYDFSPMKVHSFLQIQQLS